MRERLRIQRKREQATSFPPIQSDTLQPNSATPEQESYEVPSLVHEVLSSSGQPLGTETRSFMEPRFGHDFSQVRIHADEQAAESAQAVNALAYTVGSDVVFGQGQYAPGTSDGKRLLAHELTHVVQQNGPKSGFPEISATNTAYEHEADNVASTILSGQSTTVNTSLTTAILQRQDNNGQRPSLLNQQLHLDLQGDLLPPLLTLQGISNLVPAGPPRWLQGTSSTALAPHIPAADDPSNIVDLDFNLDIEEMSLMGYTLRRLGLPLQTSAEEEQQRFEQLHALFSGEHTQDTPLEAQLLTTAINLLGNTEAGSNLIQRAHLNNFTFIFNPATNTYGITAQFLIPVKSPF